MADHPPSFWVEPSTAQHLVCGTEHAVAQALVAGCGPQRVHRAAGMILRPEFHQSPQLDRGAERERLGLDPEIPTGLVLFGGAGSRIMKRIAQRLPHTPLILICGRNAALAKELRTLSAAAPRVVLEFTPDVAHWMRLADFFIGKPGPGSLSEAVQCGLPVIITRNAWTMPQERWNTEWVRQLGVGVVLRSFAQIAPAVQDVCARLPALRTAVQAVQNRAVFEVPQILEQILAKQGRVKSPAAASSS